MIRSASVGRKGVVGCILLYVEASATIDPLADEDSSQPDRSDDFVPAEPSPGNSPGRAIFPKSPCLRHRTARRAVLTWEFFG